MDKVSIPFKRESVSKVSVFDIWSWGVDLKFQFPSNGKAYPKSRVKQSQLRVAPYVSIPFKRESVSKAGPGMC